MTSIGGAHGPPIAVGLPVGCRPGRDHGRDERDDEADQVARHVPSVGQERERSAQHAAHHLHHEERADDRDRHPEAGAVRGRPVGVRVIVRVCHPLQRRRGCPAHAVMGMSRVLSPDGGGRSDGSPPGHSSQSGAEALAPARVPSAPSRARASPSRSTSRGPWS